MRVRDDRERRRAGREPHERAARRSRAARPRSATSAGGAEGDLAAVQAQHRVPGQRLRDVVGGDEHARALRPRACRSARSGRAALGASRPVNGSSKSTTSASCSSARATSTRWRCPPESSPNVSRACRRRPTRSSASSAAARSARPGRRHHGPRPSAPISTTSSARDGVVQPRALGLRHGPAAPAHASSVPRRGASSPSSARISVVLPPPLGPSTPTRSPARDGQRHVLEHDRAAAVADGQAAAPRSEAADRASLLPPR